MKRSRTVDLKRAHPDNLSDSTQVERAKRVYLSGTRRARFSLFLFRLFFLLPRSPQRYSQWQASICRNYYVYLPHSLKSTHRLRRAGPRLGFGAAVPKRVP